MCEQLLDIYHISTFLDLEASVAHEEVEFSDSEDDDNDFIADKEEWGHGDMTDSPMADLFADISTPLVEEDRWGNLLERVRVRVSNSKILLDSSEGFKFGLLDTPPGLWVLSCWPGWEDIVVFHIGRCTRPEQGIKATFIMLLIEEQVWLEADMSADLKSWLVDIPGVMHCNQQVVLHAVSHEEIIPGSWIKLGPKSIPKLFSPTAVKAIEKGHSRYRSLGFTYKYDLLIKWFQFSLIQSALDIPGSLATVFAQSQHPQIRRNISCLPRISEWCFQIGDKITDTSRG
ncbi:hypothetical protein F5146DRAFT_1005366 [Armillaria mellea]|nr:hypothetical protein F5146DRAFT_1005366 [Armillaria mellea]